jgi:hypothetical protein
MTRSKWLCAVLTALCVLGGPVAPLVASAQMVPATPPPPPPPAMPPPVNLRAPSTGDAVGAGFLNVIYVPGKVITCSAGALAGTGLMLLTFGSAYRAATTIFRDGCGGHWILTPYDVSGMPTPDDP